ncbi:MAG: hypothetical protein KDD41_12955 [Flavobacteriales bacterium]|nr:hypothetical protein [Flavobacteriales bacterium]
MKNWINSKKIALLVALLGSISGYLYWNYVGCASGTCAITSVWWRSTIYGAIMGYLLGDIIQNNLKKQNHEN